MDGLVLIKLIVIAIILGTSLFSYIGYRSRRGSAKRVLSSVRQSAAPLRRLSPAERQALEPFLHDPLKPDIAVPLDSDEVFALEGEYQRHGLEGSGHSTWHDTLGGVEVILPFDAGAFLDPVSNRAEVVFTDRFAVVLRLNDSFELLEGRDRDARRETQHSQWTSGGRGALKEVFVDDSTPGDETDAGAETHARVDILGQRDETPAEIEQRMGRGLGLLPGLFWLLAFLALAIASMEGLQVGRYVWLAVAGVLAVAGLWFFWRTWRPGPAQKVNRVSGELNILALQNEGSEQPAVTQLMLGDKLAFTLPPHWLPHLDLRAGQRLETELRVEDCSAVRLGHRMALDDEIRRFPLAYWGKHLAMVIVAGAALLWVLAVSPGVRGDIAVAANWLGGKSAQTFSDVAALQAAVPRAGAMVTLTGDARCEVRQAPTQWADPGIRCDLLRWGGAPMALDNAEMDDVTARLAAGNFIHTRRDPYLELMMQLRAAGRDSRQRSVTPVVITRPDEIVSLVDAACDGDTAPRERSACSRLRDIVFGGLHLNVDTPPESWEALQTLFSEHAAQDEAVPEAVSAEHHINDIKRQAQTLANERASAQMDDLAKQISAAQRGGVVIAVHSPGDATLPWDNRQPGAARLRLQRLLTLAKDDGAQAFRVSGLVLSRSQDGTGAEVLWVDASRSLAQPWPATVRAVWILLAALLVLVHGVVFAARYRAARQRDAALAAHYRR